MSLGGTSKARTLLQDMVNAVNEKAEGETTTMKDIDALLEEVDDTVMPELEDSDDETEAAPPRSEGYIERQGGGGRGLLDKKSQKAVRKLLKNVSRCDCGRDAEGEPGEYVRRPADQPLSPLEVVYPDGYVMTASTDIPEFVLLKVVLDSGAGVHVAAKNHIAGYKVVESALSRAGASFVAADGGRIHNEGEALLNIETEDAKGRWHKVTSMFQVAEVTRPLWSVGVICDSGLDVDKTGYELCYFPRDAGGLYIATVRVRNPEHPGFTRPGA